MFRTGISEVKDQNGIDSYYCPGKMSTTGSYRRLVKVAGARDLECGDLSPLFLQRTKRLQMPGV